VAHIRGFDDVVFWTGAQIFDWYKAERSRLGLT
jgi:hypothetical protein